MSPVRTILESPWLYCTARLLLSALFIYAGISKLLAPTEFAATIRDLGLVFQGSELPLAVGISAVEVLCGIGLALDVRGALGAIFLLLLAFIAILAYGIGMGFDFDCGCLGMAATHSLKQALFMDLVLLVSCVFLYSSRRMRGSRPTGLLARWRRLRNPMEEFPS